MDNTSYENWMKIKETFEKTGSTDNFYYQRACAIVSGKPDPIDNIDDTQDD
jgi:hypothetical protein